MSVRTRFAPSPTGYLHIGGARTALYNFLIAKANGGQYIMRVEDTDLDRSRPEFEVSLVNELKWLGITHDEGADIGGPLGPYRQSERLPIYQQYCDSLVASGEAFYDFCTDEELEAMKEENMKTGKAAYTGKWRDEAHFPEAKKRVEAGELTSVRFKVDPNKAYTFKDLVRDEVTFPPSMVGDFVIMRSNGLPTYNFCNVIDDHLHKITHVLRGEEHLNNTVRQLMIYEALRMIPPEFGHLSIMIGSDRQKLSKRHGATSVNLYKEDGYLPAALMNYLCLLGWSHPEDKSIFTIKELESIFDLTRFNNSPAMYDIEKLNWTNSQHLRLLSDEDLLAHANDCLPKEGIFQAHNDEWKVTCLNLLKDKIQVITEVEKTLEHYFKNTDIQDDEDSKEILGWETTAQVAKFLEVKLKEFSGESVDADSFSRWMEDCKNTLGVKGKPLFMGFRFCLTGQNHGPDLKILIPLLPKTSLLERVQKVMR